MTFYNFSFKTIQKTQHHQFVFAQKDSVEISVRLVESILVIQIHARLERPAHKLEAGKMILSVHASLATLDVSAIEVFKSFLENQSTKFIIRANIFKIYNTVSYRFTFLMKSLSEAHMIQHSKSFPIKLYFIHCTG